MRSWIVIPATGVVSAAAAVAISRDPFVVAASGLAGAAVADAVRALQGSTRGTSMRVTEPTAISGRSDPTTERSVAGRGATDLPATLVAAVLAPLLVIASLAERHAIAVAPCVAVAAIAWTIALLAKQESPLVALLPAVVAAVFEPAATVLVPIAGARIMQIDTRRLARVDKQATTTSSAKAHATSRAALVLVPIAGGLAVMLAVIAGCAHHGTFAKLGLHWFGPAHPIAARALPALLADALGPLTAVAAIAGLVQLAKLRLAEVAVIAVAAGSLLCDLRAGTAQPTTLALAALCAALAVARFARTIRFPSIQAMAGATIAAILLVPPAWTAVELMR